MPELNAPAAWLPLAFLVLMALAILAYVVLDGYDLGIGILCGGVEARWRDPMLDTIAPFWDANETWLVLGIGLLLTAFPVAHGLILGDFYLPVSLMLLGLVLRGVAFDFRIKANDRHKGWWTRAFFAGSLLAALAQGYMLGLLVTGFERTAGHVLFACAMALGLPAGYCLLGAGWLLLKAEPALRQRAQGWAGVSLGLTTLAVLAVSLVTPLLRPAVAARWFALPQLFWLAPLPLLSAACLFALRRHLARAASAPPPPSGRPLALASAVFVLAFGGLAYSLFPWLVPDRLDIWQAAAAPGSLFIIFFGVVAVLPFIVAYTVWSYRVFHGPAASWQRPEGGPPE